MPVPNPTGEIGVDSLCSCESCSHDKLDSESQSIAETLYLTDVSSRDKPWDVHKRVAETVSKLYSKTQFKSYGTRIERCARWLEFALVAAETGEIDFRLFTAWFCRVRHCPICQSRRALMWRARVLKTIPKIVQNYPKARYIHLTLTVRNSPVTELRETIKLMNNAWSKLTHRKNFPAIGFVKSLEVTRGKDNSAHPHFHCFLMVSPSYFTGRQYLSKDKWIELWQSCLGVNYKPSIDVQVVKPRQGVDVGEVEGLIWGICETLKYTVKEADLVADPEWLGELTRQMHKLRAVSVGGVLKDYLSEDDPDKGDLIHSDEESKEELENAAKLIFDWAEDVKRYAARNTR